jgi:broad specificity phosphatase PhoE
MTSLLLIRHGQTTWNAERRLQGQQDAPLSPQGLSQAEAVAKRLASVSLDAIVTSDLMRACHTAETINRFHCLPLFGRSDLREVNLGQWEGRTVTELEKDASEADLLAKWRTDSVANRPPGGERLEELQTRVINALEQIVQQHPRDRVAVVSHGGVIKAAVSWVLGLPLDHQRRFEINNTSITKVTFGARGPILEYLNDVSHWSEFGREAETKQGALPPSEDAP